LQGFKVLVNIELFFSHFSSKKQCSVKTPAVLVMLLIILLMALRAALVVLFVLLRLLAFLQMSALWYKAFIKEKHRSNF
jgi:hypothetical protein